MGKINVNTQACRPLETENQQRSRNESEPERGNANERRSSVEIFQWATQWQGLDPVPPSWKIHANDWLNDRRKLSLVLWGDAKESLKHIKLKH